MTDILASERELAEFIKNSQDAELMTWNQPRTKLQLGSFVMRQMNSLDEHYSAELV